MIWVPTCPRRMSTGLGWMTRPWKVLQIFSLRFETPDKVWMQGGTSGLRATRLRSTPTGPGARGKATRTSRTAARRRTACSWRSTSTRTWTSAPAGATATAAGGFWLCVNTMETLSLPQHQLNLLLQQQILQQQQILNLQQQQNLQQQPHLSQLHKKVAVVDCFVSHLIHPAVNKGVSYLFTKPSS